jgi:tetratricopeptide (TPR) repeat protein
MTWIAPVAAQTSKLQLGRDNFMNGSYHKALEYFNQAVASSRELTPEILSDVYYYRGLTYIRLYNEAYSGDDRIEQDRFKDALLSAYYDLKASMVYDNGNNWKKIDLEIKNIHHPLLQEGLASLNQYNDLVFNGKPDPKVLARAEEYLVAAHEIRESYLVCDLLGQVYLDKGMKVEAEEYFTKAETLYTAKLPDEPDFLMAYVFYRLAAIHKEEDARMALQDDQRGILLLEGEYERFTGMKDSLPEDRAKEMEDDYRLALKDLINLKLDLYLSDTGNYVEAIHVFEEELSKDPGNTDILIGYASLLERSDRRKAVQTYERALGLDPGNVFVLFNLGVLYYTMGRELFDTAEGSTDDIQFEILMQEAMGSFEKARPYFEQALAIDPERLECIQALKSIAYVMDDQAAYLKYQGMEQKLSR